MHGVKVLTSFKFDDGTRNAYKPRVMKYEYARS
jgi:hypothetical protein